MHQFSLSVGPVAATVLTAFLILLTFYCYKARTSGLSCVLDDPDSQAIAPAIASNYPEEMEDLTPEEHNSRCGHYISFPVSRHLVKATLSFQVNGWGWF